jgi:hypothetical protein
MKPVSVREPARHVRNVVHPDAPNNSIISVLVKHAHRGWLDINPGPRIHDDGKIGAP